MREEPNARIHQIAFLMFVTAGFLLDISFDEWMAVIVVSGMVLATEAVNASIERLADVVSPEWSVPIRNIKDLSAAAVLICAIAAVVTALVIFVPRLTQLLNKG